MASGRTDQIAFPFFSLPPEVRNIVYSFALTSSSLRTRCPNAEKRWRRLGLIANCPKKRIAPSPNLLLANRQTYHEASHILYRHGRFAIPAFVFNTLDSALSKPPGVTGPSQPAKTFSDLATRSPHKHLSQIRNVEIEIHWFRSVRGTLRKRSLAGRMDGTCRRLSVFPHLKTITITWQSYSADPARLKGVELFDCLAKQRTLELLQSFRNFQRERPEVVVVVEAPSRLVLVHRNTKERQLAIGLEEFMRRLEILVDLGTWN